MITIKSKNTYIALAAKLLFVGVIYKFVTAVFFHLGGSGFGGRYDLLAFLMPLVVLLTFLHLFSSKRGKLYGTWAIIGFFYCVYIIFITLASQMYGLSQLPFVFVNMTYWFVAMYVTYEYKRSYPDENWIVKLMFCTLVICFVGFCLSIGSAHNISFYANRDLLLNSVYYCLFLLPFVSLSKAGWVRNIGFLLVFISVVLSNKRAALIVVIACLFVMMLFQVKSVSGFKKISRVVLYTLCAVALIYLFQWLIEYYDLAILERFQAFMSGEDTGSGRTEIWADTINQIKSENFLISLLGRGYRAVSVNSVYIGRISETHNDYLQILFDYGVFGLTGIISFIISILAPLRAMHKTNYRGYLSYLLSFLIFGVCSMLSQCLIYHYWFLGIATFWGYSLADYERGCLPDSREEI